MSTYRKLHGRSIQAVTTDPSESVTEGQVWYNTTSDTFKSVVALEAWSSAAPLIVARDKPGNAGTQTAALAFGGSPNLTSSDEYDGSSFKSAPALNAGKEGMGSGGTTSAAWKAGGNPPTTTTATEEYNGSSWTTVPGTLNSGRYIMGSCGTQTAGLCCGGYNGSGNNNESEEYNGTTWSEGNNLNTSRRTLTTFGIQTAAIAVGGQTPSVTTATESYDGTSWTTLPATYPVAFSDGSSSGTQTAGLIFAGYTSTADVTTTTRKFDGTTYSSAPSMGTATARGAAAGSQSATLAFGGTSPNPGTVVEEFNISANVVTAAAWAAGGSISTVRSNVGSTSEGSQTAAMVWGGRTGPPPSGPYTSNKSDTYDGTSFSTAPNLNTAARSRAGGGTTTAAWCSGGTQPAYINSTEEYDGSSWTSVTNAPVVFFGAGTGVQTAGLLVGINSSNPSGDAYPGTCLEYDGTNFATGGSPAADRTNSLGCSGTQTAGTMICGIPAGGSSRVKTIEEYDGSSFSTGGNALLALNDIMACCRGPQTATLITGGVESPSPGAGLTSCSNYDGTSTATTVNMGTGRRGHGSDGGQTSGLVMTGLSAGPPHNNNPNYTAAAEELTVETTALNVKTLTQS